MGVRHWFEFLGDLEALLPELRLLDTRIAALRTGTFGERFAGQVFPCEHSSGERAIDHHADSKFVAKWEKFDLGISVNKVV